MDGIAVDAMARRARQQGRHDNVASNQHAVATDIVSDPVVLIEMPTLKQVFNLS